jgi:hypothetical protein
MSVAPPMSEVALPELFHPQSHRLDASRIAKTLRLPVGSVAVAMGRKVEGVRKRPDAESLRSKLGRLYRIWAGVVELDHGNQTSIFWNAPILTWKIKRPGSSSSRANSLWWNLSRQP